MIGLGVALIFTQQDRIIALTIDAVNKRLTAPIEVADLRISFAHFPATSVAMEKVFTPGHRASEGDTLLAMEEVFLDLDLWQLVQGKVAINRLRLKGGFLNIYRESAYNNYDIWQSQDSSSSAVIALDALLLEQVNLRYRDTELPLDLLARVEMAEISDIHRPWTEALRLHLAGQVHRLRYEEEDYLQAALPLEGKARLLPAGTGYALSTSMLRIAEQLNWQVDWTNAEGFQDLRMEGPGLAVEELYALLEAQKLEPPAAYQLAGKVDLLYTFINGPQPINRLAFQTDAGKLYRQDTLLLTNFQLKGRYDYAREDRLQIEEWRWQDGAENFALKGSITSLNRPEVYLEGASQMRLARWEQLLPGQLIEEPQGMVAVDFQFRGRFKDLAAPAPIELSRSELKGAARLEGLSFKLPHSERRVERLNGALRLEQNQMKIERLFFATGESDIYLQGTFGNVLPYLLLTDQKLAVKTKVKAQQIVLDEFVPKSEAAAGATEPLAFARQLDLDLDLSIDRIQFRHFKGRQAQGKLRIDGGKISGEHLAIAADGGQYRGDFQLELPPNAPYELKAQLAAAGVDLHSVFASFDNFGQGALTAKNLSGQAGTRARLSLQMDPQLNIDLASLVLVADLEIKEGHLVQYEPLRALSRFAEVEALANVRFATLKNTISIENEVITIPNMEIHSNVLDLSLSGEHHFSNQIHYVVRLAMSDVLFKQRKAKQGGSEFDEHLETVASEDEPIIPISITGSLSEPQISLEREELSRSIQADLKKQGEALKEIFKKEPQKKEQGTGIIFEWDDD